MCARYRQQNSYPDEGFLLLTDHAPEINYLASIADPATLSVGKTPQQKRQLI